MNLKELILDWRNRKFKTDSPVRKNILFQEAKQIGILFHADDENRINAIARLVGQLEHEHKKVKVLGYASQAISVSNKLTMSEFIKKDISPLGEIRLQKVQDFIKTEFDYLFCIHTESFLPFEYILLRSHAKCRVGRYEPDKTNCYELMVEVPDGTLVKPLIEQMLYYVKKCKV